MHRDAPRHPHRSSLGAKTSLARFYSPGAQQPSHLCSAVVLSCLIQSGTQMAAAEDHQQGLPLQLSFALHLGKLGKIRARTCIEHKRYISLNWGEEGGLLFIDMQTLHLTCFTGWLFAFIMLEDSSANLEPEDDNDDNTLHFDRTVR